MRHLLPTGIVQVARPQETRASVLALTSITLPIRLIKVPPRIHELIRIVGVEKAQVDAIHDVLEMTADGTETMNEVFGEV